MRKASAALLLALVLAAAFIVACVSVEVQTGGVRTQEKHHDQNVGYEHEGGVE